MLESEMEAHLGYEKHNVEGNNTGNSPAMAMYAKGMSQRDIEESLKEIYDADISQTLISKISDKILPEINE